MWNVSQQIGEWIFFLFWSFSVDQIHDILIKSMTNTNQLDFFSLSNCHSMRCLCQNLLPVSVCICIEIIRCCCHASDRNKKKKRWWWWWWWGEREIRKTSWKPVRGSFFLLLEGGSTCISFARRMIVSVTVYECERNGRNLTLLSSKKVLVAVKTSLFSSAFFFFLLLWENALPTLSNRH